MFPTGRKELEQILKQSYELILSFGVGQEKGKKYREVARPDEDLLGEFLGIVFGFSGMIG